MHCLQPAPCTSYHLIMQISNYMELSQRIIVENVSKKVENFAVEGATVHLKICSVGCGAGELDSLVVANILEKYPEVSIEYLGIDINEVSCHKAEKTFASLVHKKLKFDFLNSDILDVSPQDVGKFDFVVVSHVLYYVKALEDVLMKCQEIRKPGGGEFLGLCILLVADIMLYNAI